MQRLRTWVEAAGIYLLRLLFLMLPPSLVTFPGALLGGFLFHGLRFKRRLTLENLALALGGRPGDAALKRLGSRCYRHFGAVLGEFMLLGQASPAQVKRWMTLDNPEVLTKALAEGRGVLLVSGHLGNWELMSAAIVAAGHVYTMYVGKQKNPWADRFINAVRSAYGAHIVPKQGGMRGMIRSLRDNQVLGLLADQHFSRNRHFVNFFGRPVSVVPGPGALAMHSRPALVFAESWREGGMKYRTRFTRLELPAPSGNEEWDLLTVSQRISDAVETAVRRHPEQYFWMHRRWRDIPPDRQPTAVNRRFLAEAPPTPEPRA
ncbi:MAG: lysophospholipid acyltransferase family protein [Deltaproteobacteria bacterium]|nr:lysophospholipid acyltransferase family protein [Deltaproteobacteria bacterium]